MSAENVTHLPSISDTLVYWQNFLLYIFFLGLILRRPVKDYWRSRHEALAASVHRAAAKQLDAQERLRGAKEKLGGAAAEEKQIVEMIISEGHQEAKFMIASSREEAARIVVHAQESNMRERRSLITHIQKRLAEAALSRAESSLNKSSSKDLHERLLREAIASTPVVVQ